MISSVSMREDFSLVMPTMKPANAFRFGSGRKSSAPLRINAALSACRRAHLP